MIKKINLIKITANILLIMSLIYIVRFPYNHGSYMPLAIAIALFVLDYLKNKKNRSKSETVLYRLIQIGFVYFVITFTIFCVTVAKNRELESDKDYDVIVVLGAGLKDGQYISQTLAYRLDKAIELYELKNVPIVVSGGQGPDELVSEASAMKDYLVSQGIDESEIYMEDKSTSTEENFEFSKIVLDAILTEDYEIVFTSSDFHIARAEKFMKESGLIGYGVGSESVVTMIPSNYLREYVVTHMYYLKALK